MNILGELSVLLDGRIAMTRKDQEELDRSFPRPGVWPWNRQILWQGAAGTVHRTTGVSAPDAPEGRLALTEQVWYPDNSKIFFGGRFQCLDSA